MVLHPLEAADGHAELLASLTVLDGHLEDGLATADLVCAQHRQRPFHRARQPGPPFVLALAGTSTLSNLTSACQPMKPGRLRALIPFASLSTMMRLIASGAEPLRTATIRWVAAIASLTNNLAPLSR